ncbi:MAG: xanthine dehydrogenase [Spirochaetales bacterium]|nr:MAG: xanthine dehydrogenase [Spirochaetales bacterium]
MIPFDIAYLRAETVEEAVSIFAESLAAGKNPRYFAGGTELVTSARDATVTYDTVIDIKRIPETTVVDTGTMEFGAAVRLSRIADLPELDIISRCAGGVADRTARNSITFGGNICGMLPYREAALPVLLLNGSFRIAGPEGVRDVPAMEAFEKRLHLAKGELLVSVVFPEPAPRKTCYVRRTREPRVDYPLATVAMASVEGGIRCAIGGAFGYPVRNTAAEEVLSGYLTGRGTPEDLAEQAVGRIPDRLWDDLRGTGEYRRALLVQAMAQGLVALEAGT